MQESNLNFEEMHGPAHPSGALQAYLRPEVEVQHVELEAAIAASATSGPTPPDVTDWTDDTGDNSGVVGWP